MNTKIKLQSILLVFLLILLFFTSTNSWVSAQVGGNNVQELQNAQTTGGTLTETGLVSGGPGFIMVSPMDFHPQNPGYLWEFNGSGLSNSSLSSEISMMVAGLSLPHGATLKKMTVYFLDSSSVEDMQVQLLRGDGMAVGTPMASMPPAGSELSYRYLSETTIANPIVDNQNYSYYLSVYFPPDVSSQVVLAQVRLDYDYPSYLPTVMK